MGGIQVQSEPNEVRTKDSQLPEETIPRGSWEQEDGGVGFSQSPAPPLRAVPGCLQAPHWEEGVQCPAGVSK